MIYILLTFLLVFFVSCYLFSGKDFFAPATIQILTFAGSFFMCIYFMFSMDAVHEFHWETIIIIVSAMGLTSLIGIAVHSLFKKIAIKAHTPESVAISPISGSILVLLVGVILFTIMWLLLEIRRIGGTSGLFFETMKRFHDINSYSTDDTGRLPWLLTQLLTLLRILFLIFSFNLIRFFKVLTVSQKCANFFVLGLCCLGLLLTGGRTPVINQIICCFMMFHLLRIQKNGIYKQYQFKTLVRFALLLIAVMGGFFLAKNFVGRAGKNNSMNPVDYLAYYTGTQFIAFDQYLQNPPYSSSIIGKETFYSFNQFLINYKLADIPPYIVHLEFRPVGAGFTTNVYTFLRAYHHDFGMGAMWILHSLSIFLLSSFYEFVKKKRGSLGILIFSQMYYTIVMSFFAERFYSNVFSLNYLKQIIIMVVLYELLIRKRIRLKLRRTVHVLQPIPIRQESHTIDS